MVMVRLLLLMFIMCIVSVLLWLLLMGRISLGELVIGVFRWYSLCCCRCISLVGNGVWKLMWFLLWMWIRLFRWKWIIICLSWLKYSR